MSVWDIWEFLFAKSEVKQLFEAAKSGRLPALRSLLVHDIDDPAVALADKEQQRAFLSEKVRLSPSFHLLHKRSSSFSGWYFS